MTRQELADSPLCLVADQLKKRYGPRNVVDGLSFDVKRGEIVGLLGPNGAGKTTAFYMTVGLIRPDAGKISFNGDDVTKAPMYERARRGMGYLAQEPSVFQSLTVEQNILCVLENTDLAARERKQRMEELLAELRLESLGKARASTLSGGERRRLEIARALVTNPSFLMLDEPFANIDPITIHDVKEMIRHLSRKRISVLITDHNAREIFSIVDRAYIVQKGQVMLAGTVDTLVKSPIARSQYLGEDFHM